MTDKSIIYNWIVDALYYSNLTERLNLFDDHPSIQLIMNKYQKSFNFKFGLISTNHLRKYIDEIGCDKSSSGDIPANIIKMAE